MILIYLPQGKKGGKGGKDAGTGTGFDEDDDLDLNKETTVEDDTPAEVEEDSAEILQSKLVRKLHC